MPPACRTHLHVRAPFAHRRRELVCHAVLGLFGRGRVSDLAASQQHVSSVPLRALTARLAFARPAFGVPEVMAVLGSLQASCLHPVSRSRVPSLRHTTPARAVQADPTMQWVCYKRGSLHDLDAIDLVV